MDILTSSSLLASTTTRRMMPVQHRSPMLVSPAPLPTEIYDAVLDQRMADAQTLAPAPEVTAQTRLAAEMQAALHGDATKLTGPTTEDLLQRLPEPVRDEVARALSGEVDASYYGPEATAGRIVDFVLSGFAHFEGGAAAQEGTAEARQRFVDFILPAIDQGFAEARAALGELSADVEASIDQTYGLIGEQLDAFAAEPSVDVTA